MQQSGVGIMTRLSKPDVEDVRKGAWTAEEDEKLRLYVEINGTGHWRSVGKKAGTNFEIRKCNFLWTADLISLTFQVLLLLQISSCTYHRKKIREGLSADRELCKISNGDDWKIKWFDCALLLQGCRDVGRAVDCGGPTTYVRTSAMEASALLKKISLSNSTLLMAAGR